MMRDLFKGMLRDDVQHWEPQTDLELLELVDDEIKIEAKIRRSAKRQLRALEGHPSYG
jgi:hypothetical protein